MPVDDEGSPFRLLPTLSELRLVVDLLDERKDAFAFALVCTQFRAVVCLRSEPLARFPNGIRTARLGGLAMWMSPQRLEWAVGAGRPMTAGHMSKAAKVGQLEAA